MYEDITISGFETICVAPLCPFTDFRIESGDEIRKVLGSDEFVHAECAK